MCSRRKLMCFLWQQPQDYSSCAPLRISHILYVNLASPTSDCDAACGFKGIKMWNVRIISLVAKAWKTSKSASDPMTAISQESGLMLIDREAFTGEKSGKCTWMEVRETCIEPQAGGGGGEHGSADRKLPTEAVKHTLSSQHVQANPTWTRLNKVQLHMATLWGTIEP